MSGQWAAAASGGIPWPSEPMLAKPTDVLPPVKALPGGCLYEPKWDGYRGLVGVDAAGAPRIRSRRGVDLTAAFPDIAAAAAEQLPAGTLLDGVISRPTRSVHDICHGCRDGSFLRDGRRTSSVSVMHSNAAHCSGR